MMANKIAIVYSSSTGNTQELVSMIYMFIKKHPVDVVLYRIEDFPLTQLKRYDAIIIGTYTWGNGEIPQNMKALYNQFELQVVKNVVTGVVGTGDSFYPEFCGAVDKFRDMLHVQTDLAVTLKVELTPQLQDIQRCLKFVDKLLQRVQTIPNRKLLI